MLSLYTLCFHGQHTNDTSFSLISCPEYEGPDKQLIVEYLLPTINVRHLIKQIKYIFDIIFRIGDPKFYERTDNEKLSLSKNAYIEMQKHFNPV
jgi:hypothetical protein